LQGVDVLADIVIVFLILSASGSVAWQTFSLFSCFCLPQPLILGRHFHDFPVFVCRNH
jgi:hypothetical protein